MGARAAELKRAVHVRLDADQYAELEEAARERRTGMATVMRQALDHLLHPPKPEPDAPDA